MRLEDLRPIGTEYWQEYPVSPVEGFQHQCKFLYRIIAHDECATTSAPNGPSHWGERIEPVEMWTRPVIGIKFVQLSDRAVTDFVFGEWAKYESTGDGG